MSGAGEVDVLRTDALGEGLDGTGRHELVVLGAEGKHREVTQPISRELSGPTRGLPHGGRRLRLEPRVVALGGYVRTSAAISWSLSAAWASVASPPMLCPMTTGAFPVSSASAAHTAPTSSRTATMSRASQSSSGS